MMSMNVGNAQQVTLMTMINIALLYLMTPAKKLMIVVIA